MTPKDAALRLARRGQIVTILALVGLVGVYVRAIVYTPTEASQGLAQKIFYIHAPVAIMALGAFLVTGLLSLVYLWLKDLKIDRAAASSAEVGVVFSVIMLTTGPIWGKPIWGTWWSWDARLTFTLFLFLMFVSYLVMRGSVLDPEQRARFSAVFGILGLVLVPFIHLTVYMFRTLHPDPVVIKPSGPSMPAAMTQTFLLSIGVFVVLYVGYVMQRHALAHLEALHEEEVLGDS